MYLLRMRLTRLGPFDDVEFAFAEEGGPRLATVIHGGGGVGKTSLLIALACTRPGNALVSSAIGSEHEQAGFAVCEFLLGQDDPERPHPLVVATPNARVFGEDDGEVLRRKEQTLFDRVAKDAGFVFVSIPSTRWFSRQPIIISERGMNRYDVRAPISLDDPSRSDLARETKQVLAYGAITKALGSAESSGGCSKRLAAALEHATNSVLAIIGFRWIGIDNRTLEPQFRSSDERTMSFDQLPTRARHLVAFAVLPVRALWAAYPHRDPLDSEGIVAIDEVDLHQDPNIHSGLIPALATALPKVQWIVTSTSPHVASGCDSRDVIALRRSTERGSIDAYTGALARIH